MSLLPEWAPNIHPMLVHFPIALLFAAGALNLMELILPGDWWDERKSTILYAAGAVSGVIVYFTGDSAADLVFLETAAQPVLTDHADWALWTVWYFGIYVVVRAVLHWKKWLRQKGIRLLVFAAVLPGLFLLYETGEHGAELVFGYGTGTGQLLQSRETTPVRADSLAVETSTSFSERENGDWSWKIGPGAVGTLLSRYQWLQGEPEQLEPRVVGLGENNYGLEIKLDKGVNLFVGDKSYQNIQLDAYLDLTGFEGEVEIVHHLQDSVNYNFVRLSSAGMIVQGRRAEGEDTFFEKGSFNPGRMLLVRAVADGSHFRAYVDRKLKLHGHAQAPTPGKVGIKMNGSGEILIYTIELTQL